jgi:CHASE3 domain sensor protein
MTSWLEWIKKNAIFFSAVLVLVLITVNTGIVYYNDWVLKKNIRVKAETERAIFLTNQLWNQVVRNVDVGMRGFAITKADGLLSPMRDGIRDNPKIQTELRALTASQGFDKPIAIDSIGFAVGNFIRATEEMVALIRIDSMREFREKLSKDPGRDAWQIYARNSAKINDFENSLNEHAQEQYSNASNRTVIVQVILNIIALPTLIFLIFRINRDWKVRRELFSKLDKNNREFLFNPGESEGTVKEDQVIDASIANFKTATHFISQISNGNFAATWDSMTPENEALNTKNLAGELVRMRDKLKKIKADDEVRNWTTEGIAKFSDVLRHQQDNLQALSLDILTFLTKYLGAQQGCLFVLNDDDGESGEYLDMTACYAFEKRKHITKRIEIGQGIIGQVYMEKEAVLMTDVPQGYTEITSGLGHRTPTSLLIVPMKYNEKVEAVIELAGFRQIARHEIDFMERVGELTASALGTARRNERLRVILDQSKMQTEQLRAQEEEMRQNMEEMQATQEALVREQNERKQDF